MKKFFKEFFCIPKYATTSDEIIKTNMIFSTLSVIVCCIVFCTTTFAWFTGQQDTSIDPVKAASFSLAITIDDESIGTVSSKASADYSCPLVKKDQHTCVLTPNGTAVTGYCIIDVEGDFAYIVQFTSGESITLTIIAAEDAEISFSASWGEYSGELSTYGNGDRIKASYTPFVTYVVEDGVTLDEIAAHYQSSAADILRYNGITELTVGEEIMIPNPAVTTPMSANEAESEDTVVTGSDIDNTQNKNMAESPADKTPSDETPSDETPSDETPSDETPSDETPSDETPAGENPTAA